VSAAAFSMKSETSKNEPLRVRIGSNLCKRRICIIGARGVGKSTAVRAVIPDFPRWKHVEGSKLLERYADVYGVRMADLDPVAQDVLRQFASDDMRSSASSEYEGFICEGHSVVLSDPSSHWVRYWRKFLILLGIRHSTCDQIKAFTHLDEAFFNEVILVEARPEVIQERRRKDVEKKRSLVLEDIIADMQAERSMAAEICRQSGATLRVFDAEMEDLLEATLRRILSSREAVVETVAMVHQEKIIKVASRYKPDYPGQPIFLFDADGTLSEVDVSHILMEICGNGLWAEAKKNFKRSGYNHYSFVLHDYLHMTIERDRFISLTKALGEKIEFYQGVISCLKRAIKLGPVIILTAGVPEVWRVALTKCGLAGVNVHGLVDFEERLVMDEQGKETFAAVLKEAGFRVIATGDGQIDTGMLRISDAAFMVFKIPPLVFSDLGDEIMSNGKPRRRLKEERMLLLLASHTRVFSISPIVHFTFGGPPPSTFEDLIHNALEADYPNCCADKWVKQEQLMKKFYDELKHNISVQK
jgi:hypothetical protein